MSLRSLYSHGLDLDLENNFPDLDVTGGFCDNLAMLQERIWCGNELLGFNTEDNNCFQYDMPLSPSIHYDSYNVYDDETIAHHNSDSKRARKGMAYRSEEEEAAEEEEEDHDSFQSNKQQQQEQDASIFSSTTCTNDITVAESPVYDDHYGFLDENKDNNKKTNKDTIGGGNNVFDKTQSITFSKESPPLNKNGVRISTMTMVFDLNQTVDLRAFAHHFPYGNVVFDPNSVAFERANGRKKGSFQNQATLMIRIGRKSHISVSACIFCNGRIKLAGCRSEEQGRKVAELILQGLKLSQGIHGKAVANSATLQYSNLRIVMTKADFDIGFPISLERATHILGTWFTTRYEPSRYCGLIVEVTRTAKKAEKPLNVMVFSSGKAFVSGNCGSDEILTAFDAVRKTLESNKEMVLGQAAATKKTSATTRKRKTTA